MVLWVYTFSVISSMECPTISFKIYSSMLQAFALVMKVCLVSWGRCFSFNLSMTFWNRLRYLSYVMWLSKDKGGAYRIIWKKAFVKGGCLHRGSSQGRKVLSDKCSNINGFKPLQEKSWGGFSFYFLNLNIEKLGWKCLCIYDIVFLLFYGIC